MSQRQHPTFEANHFSWRHWKENFQRNSDWGKLEREINCPESCLESDGRGLRQKPMEPSRCAIHGAQKQSNGTWFNHLYKVLRLLIETSGQEREPRWEEDKILDSVCDCIDTS
jgi:hypothetical protein